MLRTFIISAIFIFIFLSLSTARPQCTGLATASEEGINPDFSRLSLSLNFTNMAPIGSFKNRLNGSGNGFAFKMGYNLRNLPLTFGMEYNFIFYDYQNIGDYYYSSNSDNYSDEDIFFYSGFDMMLINLKLQPTEAFFRPYIEAVAGASWYYTSSVSHFGSIFSEYGEGEFYGSLNNDFGLNAGFGAGLSVLSNKGKSPEVLIDAGFRFLFGSQASVVKKGTIDKVDGYVEYESVRTPTNQIHFLLGVTVKF